MRKPYDLAIVGSGILGLMAAYHALARGYRVLLLDANRQPMDATVRNFGALVPSGQADGQFRHWGEASLGCYRHLAKQWQLPVRETGTTYVAQDEQEARVLQEKYALEKAAGFSPELLSTDALSLQQPGLSDHYPLGLHFAHELSVDSQAFVHQFIEKLQQQKNIDIAFSTPVIDVTGQVDAFHVITANQQKFPAKQVLLCCGHRHAPFMQPFYAQEPLRLCQLQMMKTRPLKPMVIGNLLGGLSVRRYAGFKDCKSYPDFSLTPRQKACQDKGIHVLFKQTETGEIILGDSHQYYPFDTSTPPSFFMDAEVNRLLIEEARTLIPINDDAIAQHWLGWYVEHQEGAMKKSVEKGFHIVTGLGGKGMTVGPALMAQVIHEIVDDKVLQPIV